jgi:AmmeMemoRadiSam system protein B
MPTVQDCPRLRPGLAAAPDRQHPHFIILWDQLGLCPQPQRLNVLEFSSIQMFNGRNTLLDIQAKTMRQLGGVLLPLEFFASLVERLDAALFLDGPRFQECAKNPVREPACIGTYPSEPEAICRQLERLFTDAKGPGLPGEMRGGEGAKGRGGDAGIGEDGSTASPHLPLSLSPTRQAKGQLRAALIPHIDFHRGGHSFAWGFKEVFEQAEASLFVIIGTSHYSAHRYTLTRKDFKTPLGIVPTDQVYIDRLVSHYGPGLFDDELAHLPEHSIELEVVFLQYLYENRRPIRIVPLVVGSFQDCILGNLAPRARTDISRMIEDLQKVESETSEPIFYIISGDLAHIGPKFGDPRPVNDTQLQNSRHMDQALLKQMEKADMDGYFRVLTEEGDCRRICGFPPTYTLLEAIQPSHGRLLNYDRYVHPQGFESVSFASVGFYR